MDILIKNMKMPKKGETRYLFIDGDGYVGIWNEGNKGFVYSHEAIPVPEHGDLIDRDALKEDAKRIQKNDTGFFIDSMSYGEALSRAVDKAEVVLERTT